MVAFDSTRPLAAGITLLEASAGTGKTYNITSVVLRLVAYEGVPIERILIVTFTEAATAELRDRVRTRLRDAAVALEVVARGGEEPKDELTCFIAEQARVAGDLEPPRRRLREALQRFDDAAISTIHGFCSRVLREQAFECGAEFDAELLEDPEEMLDEVVRDFWAREVAAKPVELVEGLMAAGLCFGDLLDLSRKAVADPEMSIVPLPNGARTWSTVQPRWYEAREKCSTGWIDEGERIEEMLASAWEEGVLSRRNWREGAVKDRAAGMHAWAEHPRNELFEDFKCFGSTYIAGSTKKDYDPPLHPIFDDVDALLAVQHEYGAAIEEELLVLKHDCAEYARAEFERRKRERRIQTYDDMLRQVQRALRDTEHGPRLAGRLRARYRAALIDEFQDTDAVQWEIFRTVFDTGEHHLVLIGDPKQAIYAFRGADIHTYLAARREAADTFDLATNWRSDQRLVDAVNHLFAQTPRPFAIEGIEHHEVEAHHQKERLVVADDLKPLEVRVIPSPDGGQLGKGRAWPLVARLAAGDIASFLESGATIEETTRGRTVKRPVSPRDIAVLVRKGVQATQIQQALRAVRVPSVRHGAASVYTTVEAEELRRVLAAMLEPANHWLARAALATDLLGVPAAAALSQDDEQPLGAGDALARLALDEAAWDEWVHRLHTWGERWTKRGFMPAFREMLETIALPSHYLALDDGERRMTNLLHLAELLHTESVQARLQPAALLAWLARQQALGNVREETRQLRLESDADAVQIVTMHGAKGLEYPVVWCPYLWDGALIHPAERKHPRFYAEVDGRMVRRLDVAPNANDPDGSLAHLQDDNFAENLRLTYVALTRARHRCVVYWGNIKEASCSPLGWLLHGSEVEEPATVRDARERLHQHVRGLDETALRATLERVAGGSNGTIGVSDALDVPVAAWTPPDRQVRTLAAREWRRATPLDRDWRVGSFTGLTHGSRGVHAAPEVEDELHPEPLADAQPLAVADDSAATGEPAQLEGFPSSAKAGILFHEIFEKHDFAKPDALGALVHERLGAYGFDAAQWGDAATAALRQAIETPLLGGDDGSAPFALHDVAVDRRLNELRFEFPVAGGYDATTDALTPKALAAALRDHPGGELPRAYADRVASLGFSPLRGFMTGVIDLVAEHDGRYHVVDYKSNRLGARMADYAPARLCDAMAEADYFLQYHLYVVALHRYLGWRLGDAYDYDRDVSGVFYLFFRGMRPSHGARCGVFHDRPPRARIEALDAALRAAEVSR